MAREYTKTELGTGYGVLVGGAVGAMLLALTGSATWLGIAVAIGLIAGSIWGQLADERSDHDPHE